MTDAAAGETLPVTIDVMGTTLTLPAELQQLNVDPPPRRLTMKDGTIYCPVQDQLPAHIAHAAQLHRDGVPMMPAEPIHAGRPGLIVGTGPSLDSPHVWRRIAKLVKSGAVVFGLKEAIALLRRRGLRVDYSVSVDGQENQVAKTPALPGITYLVASCCHPALFAHLLGNGCDLRLFHTACGAVDKQTGAPEVALYASQFPDAWVAEGGLVVANRAIACAWRLGCSHVHLAGCDFGRRGAADEMIDARSYYAKGTAGALMHDAKFFCDDGALDGRPWITQPGMKDSAQHVAGLIRAGYVSVIGDSLAKSIARHWDRLAALGGRQAA